MRGSERAAEPAPGTLADSRSGPKTDRRGARIDGWPSGSALGPKPAALEPLAALADQDV